MNDDPMAVPTVIFWVMAPLTVVAPIRWAVVLYLLLVQIDLSAVGNFSTTSFGFDNAIKAIIIPTILLFKVRKIIPSFNDEARKIAMFWAAFVACVCLAALWSPYRVSAIKMIGYLYTYGVLFVVFAAAWHQEWFSRRSLIFVMLVSLLGGFVQTYFLGNAFGTDEWGQWRFTTFAGAQSFGPFLLCILVLLLFREKLSLSIFLTALAASVGILETGSRSVFLGFLWVLMIYGVYSAVRSGRQISPGVIFRKLLWIAAGAAVMLTIVVNLLPENRLNEMFEAAVERNADLSDIGTFGWRFALYQKTLDELTQRSPVQLLIGSGTSSGADLVLEQGFFGESNVDPNRALHDEFLRAVYEWGFVGLSAFLLFLWCAFKFGLHAIREHASPEAWAFLAISAPLLISLTVENVLADSGSPGGVGYNLILTAMVAACGLLPEKEPQHQTIADMAPSLAIPARIQPES